VFLFVVCAFIIRDHLCAVPVDLCDQIINGLISYINTYSGKIGEKFLVMKTGKKEVENLYFIITAQVKKSFVSFKIISNFHIFGTNEIFGLLFNLSDF